MNSVAALSNQRGLLKFFCGLLVLLAAAGAAAYWKLAHDERFAVYLKFFEKNAPSIELIKPGPGVGLEPMDFTIRVSDEGVGLDEVIVRSEQGGDLREVYRKTYSSPKFDDLITFRINSKQLKLVEGAFALNIAVFDRSFWSNARRSSTEFKVDYAKPKLEVLSVQHNAVVGGSELIFYRVLDDGQTVHGVQVGKEQFFGFPARLLDSAFESFPDVYFAYFAVPLGFDEKSDPILVFARDEVLNGASATFYYHAQRVRQFRREHEVAADFAALRCAELVSKYSAGKEDVSENTAEQLLRLNTSYREATEKTIREIVGKPRAEPLRDGFFLRPVTGVARTDFGEYRTLTYQGANLGTFVNPGVDISGQRRMPVAAVNPGVVVFAGDLGIYGETVIVDHGFGISSLYSHLSSIGVKQAAKVSKGEVLGETGSSGLVEDDRLHFEVRIHGVPVRPIEWWDKRWVGDHIEAKIDEVKRIFGVGTQAPAVGAE